MEEKSFLEQAKEKLKGLGVDIAEVTDLSTALQLLADKTVDVSNAMDKAAFSGMNAVKSVKEFGQQSFDVVLETDIKYQALAKSMGYIPIIGEKLSENAKGVAEGLRTINDLTANEIKLFDSIGNMLKFNTGLAFKGFAELLKGAATEQQKFEIELSKLNQEKDKTIDRAKVEVQNLAILGISYDNIKEAIKENINSVNSSIRVNQEQTDSFYKNAAFIEQLIASNKRLGIETKDTAGFINFFKNTTAASNDQMQIFSDSLQKFADRTGQSGVAVFKSFTDNMNRFSTMEAPKAIESFARMEAYAKRTGQDLKNVVGSMEKFDDLSQGYEKLGKMNRILMQFGSSMDPIAFMKADDVERQKMIVEAVSKTQTKFSGLTTDAARRQVAKALSESMELPYDVALGLASGKVSGKEYLDSLTMKVPEAEMKAYTAKERVKKMQEVTSFEEAGKVRDQMLQLQKSVNFLVEGMRAADFTKIQKTPKMYANLDETVFKAVAHRDGQYFEKFREKSAEAFKTAIKEGFKGQSIETTINNWDEAMKGLAGYILYGIPTKSAPSPKPNASNGT